MFVAVSPPSLSRFLQEVNRNHGDRCGQLLHLESLPNSSALSIWISVLRENARRHLLCSCCLVFRREPFSVLREMRFITGSWVLGRGGFACLFLSLRGHVVCLLTLSGHSLVLFCLLLYYLIILNSSSDPNGCPALLPSINLCLIANWSSLYFLVSKFWKGTRSAGFIFLSCLRKSMILMVWPLRVFLVKQVLWGGQISEGIRHLY